MTKYRLMIIFIFILGLQTQSGFACSYFFPEEGLYISSISATSNSSEYEITINAFENDNSEENQVHKAIVNIESETLQSSSIEENSTKENQIFTWTPLLKSKYIHNISINQDILVWSITNSLINETYNKEIKLSDFSITIESENNFLGFDIEEYNSAYLYLNDFYFFSADLNLFNSTQSVYFDTFSAFDPFRNSFIELDLGIMRMDGVGTACEDLVFVKINSTSITRIKTVEVFSDYAINKNSGDIVTGSKFNRVAVSNIFTEESKYFEISSGELKQFYDKSNHIKINLPGTSIDLTPLLTILITVAGGIGIGAVVAMYMKKR